MKKKVVALSLAAISAITIAKADLVSQILGSLGNYISIGGFSPSTFENQIQLELMQSLGKDFQPLLDKFYYYAPSSINSNMDVSINVCQSKAFNGQSIRELYKSLPDLSAFGYYKRNDIPDLQKYCKIAFGNKGGGFDPLSINQATTDFNITKLIQNPIDENNTKNLNYANANKNAVFGTAVKDNDYATVSVFQNIMTASNTNDPSKIKTKDINVPYNTPEDYEKSISEESTVFSQMRQTLDLNKLKAHAIKEFNIVNATYNTAQKNSQSSMQSDTINKTIEQQKQSVEGKLNHEYDLIVNRYVNMKIKQRLLLEYEPAVSNPTKEYVDQFRDEDRAKVVFAIEKQKLQKAKIIESCVQEGDDMKQKARIVIRNAEIASREADETAIVNNLNQNLMQ